MARFSVSNRSTIAGTSLLPQASLYATAAVRPRIREVGVFNTTATAFVAALVRLTSLGTAGVGLVEVPEEDPARVAVATAFAGHTASAGIGGELRRASIGAAIGSGVIWTFGGAGVVVPNATTDGIGIIIPTGTGQISDFYICWEE